MSLFALFFGLMSGCFLSVLVGIVGSKRRIGFGWAFLASLFLTPLVGLLLALISDPLPVGTDRGLGCIGTLFGVLGLLFLVAFLFLLLAGGMLVAMYASDDGRDVVDRNARHGREEDQQDRVQFAHRSRETDAEEQPAPSVDETRPLVRLGEDQQ